MADFLFWYFCLGLPLAVAVQFSPVRLDEILPFHWFMDVKR